VLLLADRGFITLDVEYVDGTKIESKANKYTFVWRKSVEKNRARLQEKIRVLLRQIDEVIAQDKAAEADSVEFPGDTEHPDRRTERRTRGRAGTRRQGAKKAAAREKETDKGAGETP